MTTATRPKPAQQNFRSFSVDAGRVTANLEAAYDHWHSCKRSLAGCNRADPERAELADRIHKLDQLISDRARQYRSLRLPVVPDRFAEILRRLDVAGLLGNDVMVTGDIAMAGYELACGARFPRGSYGIDVTQALELVSCSGTPASLVAFAPIQARAPRPTLESISRTIPLSVIQCPWLTFGQPHTCVVATKRNRACPLYLPDPRVAALLMLWRSRQADRPPGLKSRDARRGSMLLNVIGRFLGDMYPLGAGFLAGLPGELRS